MNTKQEFQPKFEIGQVVKLKSGGPNMTVSVLIHNSRNPYKVEETRFFTGTVKCVWFNDTKLEEVILNQDVLEKIENIADPTTIGLPMISI